MLPMPDSNMYWLPPYVGLSFFLFCNVFRIGSRMEIFWYMPFNPCHSDDPLMGLTGRIRSSFRR